MLSTRALCMCEWENKRRDILRIFCDRSEFALLAAMPDAHADEVVLRVDDKVAMKRKAAMEMLLELNGACVALHGHEGAQHEILVERT